EPAAHPLKGEGYLRTSSSPRPAFAVWPFQRTLLATGGEVGKRGTEPGLSNFIRGRFPAPRRRSCPTWRGRRIVSPRDLGQGPVLGAHHPAAPPSRDRTGTVTLP